MQQAAPNNIGLKDNEEISISDILYKFIPYWLLFALMVIISLTMAWVYLLYKVPVYSSTAAILIKDDKKVGGVNPLGDLDIFGSQKIVENEVKVLQSKTLAQDVVKNLYLYAPVIVEGKFRKKSGYVSSPILVEARYPDSIKPTGKVYFKYNSISQQVTMNNKTYPIQQWINSSYGLLRFILNPHYKVQTNFKQDVFFNLVSIKNAANSIRGRIKIATGKQTTVIDLSVNDEVPQRGEDILNELISVYNRAALLDKNVLGANTLSFVEERLKYVVNELDSVEQRLKNYKTQNNIVDISSQGQIFFTNSGRQ